MPAESLGITICLETHGYEHGTGVSLLPFTRIHPSVMICYDTGNVLYYSNSEPAEDLPECLSAVRHVHLKDKIGGKGVWNFPAAGEGTVPFETLCKALEQQSKLSASIEIEFTPEGVTLPETRKALAKSVQYFCSLSPMQFDS